MIQVRTATIIEEDGVELSRSFSRHVVAPDISSDDLANESADVRAIQHSYILMQSKLHMQHTLMNTQNLDEGE